METFHCISAYVRGIDYKLWRFGILRFGMFFGWRDFGGAVVGLKDVDTPSCPKIKGTI